MERDGCSLKRTRDRPARVCALIMAVRFEKQDAIGYVILDRPPAKSYDRAFMDELDAAIEAARSHDAVRPIAGHHAALFPVRAARSVSRASSAGRGRSS